MFTQIVDELIDIEREFLIDIKESGKYKVFCWGPIAFYSDSVDGSGLYPVNGTEVERNLTTKYFNEELEKDVNVIQLAIYQYFQN